jgi:hypothetical protein
MQTDTKSPPLTAPNRACRPHCMIEVLDSGGNVFEKMLSRFCQPDAAVASLEKEHAKVLFELFDPCANGGLTHAQRSGCMAKV